MSRDHDGLFEVAIHLFFGSPFADKVVVRNYHMLFVIDDSNT
jgi:hypothetical protein